MNAQVHAIRARAAALRLPTRYQQDLEIDAAYLAQAAPAVFLWAIGENGTHIVYPGRFNCENLARVIVRYYPDYHYYRYDAGALHETDHDLFIAMARAYDREAVYTLLAGGSCRAATIASLLQAEDIQQIRYALADLMALGRVRMAIQPGGDACYGLAAPGHA